MKSITVRRDYYEDQVYSESSLDSVIASTTAQLAFYNELKKKLVAQVANSATMSDKDVMPK